MLGGSMLQGTKDRIFSPEVRISVAEPSKERPHLINNETSLTSEAGTRSLSQPQYRKFRNI